MGKPIDLSTQKGRNEYFKSNADLKDFKPMLNKTYEFKVETSYQTKKLKNILTYTLVCERTKLTYYKEALEIKKNKPILFILIAKVEIGYIAYFFNSVYGVGEFYLISNKDLKVIAKTWDLTINIKKYIVSQWRYFWHKDDIIKEFVNPITKATNEVDKLISEFEQIKYHIDLETKELNTLIDRFKD
jgi:hypothetical protein